MCSDVKNKVAAVDDDDDEESSKLEDDNCFSLVRSKIQMAFGVKWNL